jgi:hypothetical protein
MIPFRQIFFRRTHDVSHDRSGAKREEAGASGKKPVWGLVNIFT